MHRNMIETGWTPRTELRAAVPAGRVPLSRPARLSTRPAGPARHDARGGAITTRLRTPPAALEYQPFPNEAGRNQRQETLEVPAVVRALAVPVGARILEVGCGRGIALPALARLCQPRQLVGLDIEPAFLAEARERVADHRAELVCGDLRELPFGAGSFDVVIDFGTLYHVSRAGEGLAEVARVLAPGGMFIEETPLSQLLSHPRRSFGRSVPWEVEPALVLDRWAGLWQSRRRQPGPVPGR